MTSIVEDVPLKPNTGMDHASLFLESLPDLRPLYDPYPALTGIGDRMIGLSPNDIVFGIVVMETPDELIVCHPTKLIRESDGHVTGRLMTGTPLMKFYKSSTVSVCETDLKHKGYYYSFLLSLGTHLHDKIFTKEKLDLMRGFVGKYESSIKSKRVADSSPTEISKVEAANRGSPHFEVIPYGNTVKH